MFRNIRRNLKVLWPFILAGLVLLLVIVIIVPGFSFLYFFLFVCTLSLGFLVGSLNTPTVRFRERKVEKQKKDLSKLSEQLKIQAAAMRYAANGIIITDTKGVIQWVNPGFTKLTGYTAEESVGSMLKKLNSGHHDKAYFQNLWETILSGNVWHNEIVNRRKDGSLYTEEMTITPVKDGKNIISHFVAIKQDISERKRLEEISRQEKDRMKTELDVARNIQMSLLRHNFPAFPGRKDVDLYARLIPAREVGGDFYDFFWIDDENLCFLVGDVSGKGVPAAIMMAVTKTLLKSWAGQEKAVGEILTRVNMEISKDNDNYMFITVFIGILNTTTGYLTYSNAGHNPPYIIDHQSKKSKKLGALHGVVIGAMEGVSYGETVTRIRRGNSIVVYTDGVTEARNNENILYSDERFVELLDSDISLKPEKLVEQVIEDVKRHESGAEPADDITLLCIRYEELNEDSILDLLSFTISNKIENIRSFIPRFEESAGSHKINTEYVQQINIVFDELLSNIISYAYRDENEHEIEIKVCFYADKLTVTIMDDGIPYNPFDRQDPDTSLPLENREIGGLGVHLVKFLVDDYDYEYKDQIKKNYTHFTKYIN